MTTINDIKSWLEDGVEIGATHVIIICDGFSDTFYPIHVMPHEDVRALYREYNYHNLQFVEEVYSLSRNTEEQLAERKALYLD